MNELDRLLRNALRDRAELAPTGDFLLRNIHDRSRRLRRRHRIVAAAGTVTGVLALAIPVAVVGLARGGGEPAPQRPAAVSPSASAGLEQGPSSVSASASAGQERSPSATQRALRFEQSAFAVPSMPLRLPAAKAAAFETPVVTLQNGALVAFYPTRDPVGGADVTLVVTDREPEFGSARAAVTETPYQVGSAVGTLRTVNVRPAAELTLYWQESPTRWVQVRTDDTFTPRELAALAEALVPEALPVVVPLRFDLLPEGLELGSVTPYGVAFRPEGSGSGWSGSGGPGSGGGGDSAGSAAVSCTVVEIQPLTGSTVQVGQYQATLTRGGAGVLLSLRVPDWEVTLLVEVSPAYSVSDADLIRFAAGLRLMDAAETRQSSADSIGAANT